MENRDVPHCFLREVLLLVDLGRSTNVWRKVVGGNDLEHLLEFVLRFSRFWECLLVILVNPCLDFVT